MAIKPTMKPSKLLPESPKKTLKPFIKLKKFLDSFKYLKFYSQKVIGKEDEKRLEKFMDFEKYPNLKKVTKVDKDRLIKYER